MPDRFPSCRRPGALPVVILALAIVAPGIALSPRPAAAGITPLGNIPLSGGSTIYDVWGWMDPSTDKEYAIVGSHNRFYVVDVSDPTNPVVASSIALLSFDVKVYQNYAYIVDGDNDGNDGTVVDLSNPNSLSVVGNFPSSHNIFIDEQNGVMYLEFVGLRIFDLTVDPTNPALLWSSPGGGHDATVVNNVLYDFRGDNGTFIYNVVNPSAPVLLGSITDPAIEYHHSGWVSHAGNFLFINDELSTHPTADFTVWDITNKSAPVKVAEWADSNATVHNSFVVGNFLHVSYYTAGYRVFDISNPYAISLYDEFDTSIIYGENFRGAFGCYPFAPSGNVYVTDADNGLFVFGFDTPATGIPYELASELALDQNFPNPFNPATTISYRLDDAGSVALSVYDSRGRVVRHLLDRYENEGPHAVSWDGKDDAGHRVASGVYFYRLTALDHTVSKRMVLLK